MDFEEAKDYLKTASGRGRRLGLERVTELCRLLGDPQDSIKTIHIAGTNGKGSFGAMLSAVLGASGYKTGWFSSPALTDVTDLFRVGGRTVTRERFAEVMADVAEKAESMEDRPTEYEILAAVAYTLFSREKCDINIIECCMGGDTDCTNVIKAPLLAVITNVQKDHTDFLGSTIREIAAHKAGIIKAGCYVLFGGSDPEALDVISKTAFEKGALLYLPDREQLTSTGFKNYKEPRDTYIWTYRNTEILIRLPLIGAYQSENLLSVMTAVEILRLRGLRIPKEAVVGGLSRMKWHGRFEKLRDTPKVYFDGAHNPDGLALAVKTIEERLISEDGVIIVMGVMADKDYRLYADIIRSVAGIVLTVRPDNPRALPAEELSEALHAGGISSSPCGSMDEAVERALALARAAGMPVVALGSLYMYREFTEALDKYLPVQEDDLRN